MGQMSEGVSFQNVNTELHKSFKSIFSMENDVRYIFICINYVLILYFTRL